jgi:hypothetical protein
MPSHAFYQVASRALSSGLKQPKREADNSPPYNIKVKNDGATPFPHTSSWNSSEPIKHRENFTFSFCIQLPTEEVLVERVRISGTQFQYSVINHAETLEAITSLWHSHETYMRFWWLCSLGK